ncbi:adenylate dimethylallyltransferase Ipt [Agrobacterium vitis]|uniref:adenylate dimethylallyltransferase Ipt n=1 Tax=Agrobacterium vitis TaxID=373 RepID=UPI0012E81A22|nr:adenylate dimethylallyltransferase Ipt [Agrobacterium vitis]MVA64316.1 isopentenyl transferase [Agrobacterium vitis]
MDLRLIFGPTCTGKTSTAIALAQQTGLPVLSLDRVQCCPQLSTGSGRPTVEELKGTTRLYLEDRPLVKGIIAAKQAHERLIGEVYNYEAHGGLILEGGSISLLRCMAQSSYWSTDFRWHIIRHKLADEETFMNAAKARVRQMLRPAVGPSIIQELVHLWNEPRLRPILKEIDGYRYAMLFASQNQITPDMLLQLDPDMEGELIHGIAQEYLIHARRQEQEFPPVSVVAFEGFEGPPFGMC